MFLLYKVHIINLYVGVYEAILSACFRSVVECQTVTVAADLLNISQPVVSRLLSSLKEQLKFKLFIRQRSRLILSDESQAFYLEVAKVFDAVNRLDSAVEAIRTHL
ncbi:LysR family transcriptional regulator [Photobacterium andalusiense]|uniref:DNA-binding transcriptional regulator LysR n=1 Tax=Photobacterium andalusiense TaxID=2204296 RepID=A0A1Y6MGT6_9GAMM|nr:LysR family transcriptional regulator [Photobacterium andalusiense]SMY35000.1 DNA-binding transcriptional regulator LysR [Photobacterium andalusiense]